MKVQQLMTTTVKSCRPQDDLATAAGLMWRADCGALPVVDHDSRVVGMITDRDICMAAYTQGRTLSAIHVEPVMSKTVFTASAEDSISMAEETPFTLAEIVRPRAAHVGPNSVRDHAAS